ncbi:MAG: hypothetical protein WB930_18615 [Syntrophobacteraceae bacterium]
MPRLQEQEFIFHRFKEMESGFPPKKEEVKDPAKMVDTIVSADITEENLDKQLSPPRQSLLLSLLSIMIPCGDSTMKPAK